MITDPQLMPDFRDGLEEALYRRASAAAVPSPARRMPRVLPRPSLGGRLALGTAALIAAIAIVFTSLPGHKVDHDALAEPTILTQPTKPVPPEVTVGPLVRQALGQETKFTGVIPLQVLGTNVYLAQATTGWCISPAIGTSGGFGPSATLSCATTSQIVHIGLSSFLASNYIALVPPSAPSPTLERADGTRSTLVVSKDGVAAITGLSVGDKVIRHGVDGTTATDTFLG